MFIKQKTLDTTFFQINSLMNFIHLLLRWSMVRY